MSKRNNKSKARNGSQEGLLGKLILNPRILHQLAAKRFSALVACSLDFREIPVGEASTMWLEGSFVHEIVSSIECGKPIETPEFKEDGPSQKLSTEDKTEGRKPPFNLTRSEVKSMLSQQIQSCATKGCTATTTMDKPFPRCAKCGTAYCSREHQIEDWKAGHKETCTKASTTLYKARADDVYRREVVSGLIKAFILPLSLFSHTWIKEKGKGCLSLQAQDFMKWTTEAGIPDCQFFVSYYATHELRNTKEAGLVSLHNLSNLIDQAEENCIVVAVHDEQGYCLSLQMPLVAQAECAKAFTSHAFQLSDVDMVVMDTMTNEIYLAKVST